MTNETLNTSGVQGLITRIRDDGVKAGKEQSEQIIDQAKRDAARIVADAQAEADQMRTKVSEEIESSKHAALEALKMAARDTSLQLEASVLTAFERHVKRLIAPVTYDEKFLRTLILVLAGQAADQFLKDKKIEVLVSDFLAGKDNKKLGEFVREKLLGISGDMLREGVEIVPSSEVPGGVRVRVVDEDLEIDLTSEAVSKLLLKHLLPRYRNILEGTE